MTCIIGHIEGEKVYIGGDSAGVAGLNITQRRDVKVFKVGDFVFGCTSSFRMMQLIRFSFIPPKRHPDEDVFRYMCTGFIDTLRTCLRSGGYMEVDRNVEWGGCFLVGHQGRLFTIQSDFQVAESMDSFSSVGCGSEYASGAMAALLTLQADPVERIRQSLNIAAHFSAGVRPPFVIESI